MVVRDGAALIATPCLMAKDNIVRELKMNKQTEEPDKKSRPAEKQPTFSPDRKGEASAGALKARDKEKSVDAGRDGSNTR
jgi:hypothetical protein